MTTPNDYNLPHKDFRFKQEESIDWCFNLAGTGVAECPTGAGKTALAAAVASQRSVIALCRTKNLQSQNYGGTYGFDILFGKANYKCIHPDAKPNATGADCKFDGNMYQCPLSRSCPYMAQKTLCKASPKVSLNYAYFMTAKWPAANPPDTLFLDEAHELHELVTSFAGCTITEKDRVDWDLAQFPELRPTTGGGLLIKVADPLPPALGWLEDARNVLGRHWTRLKDADSEREIKRRRQCARLGGKIRATLDALRMCPNDWYICSGRTAQRFGRERRPAFIAKPLTARHHAGNYFGFNNGQRSVLMSATIGDVDSFTEELGITDYQSRIVPNQFPPESRAIYTLDVPSMGSKAGPSAFEKQADEIAQSILACPRDWSGLVLVTRKREAKLLADRLARRGLQDRVWATPGWDGEYKPTDEQALAWEQRKRKVPNSICLTWAFWTGYDGLDERILIIAKTPYPLWGNGGSYEAAWRAFSMSRYYWVAANMLAQGTGRTRRGREQDYDLGGRFAGFVAVADRSYKQIRKYLPKNALDALVET